MNGHGPDSGQGSNGPPDREPPDTGEPIHELAGFPAEASAGFFYRIRKGIDRRVLTGQLFEQAWTAPLRVILEYVGAVIGLLSGDDDRRRGPDSEEPEL